MFFKAEKRLLQMDWLLLGQIGLILGLNLIILSSASANVVPEQPYYYVQKQLLWMSIGLAVMIGAAFFDYRQYRRLIPVIYLLLLGLLVGVLFTAAKNNTHRWFDLGFMDFQPSELAKIILVLVCACFLAQRKNHINRPSTLLGAALGMGIPAVLILIEPDLGSALLIGVLLVVMLGLAGLDKKYLLLLLLLLLLLAGGLFGILYQASAGFSHNISDTDLPAWLPLQGYQAMRLIIFIN
ncbi:MAG: FtsW/RodA/SpoVE family cell cycle protein, partial [Clostridiales bacterium]